MSAGGRPPFEVKPEHRRLVEVLRGNGVAVDVIALLVGCDQKTVRRHFKTEMLTGKDTIKARLGAIVVRAALSGDWRAALAWLARFGGDEWRERHDVDLTAHGPDISAMTDEQIAQEIAEIEAKRRAVAEARASIANLPNRPNGSVH